MSKRITLRPVPKDDEEIYELTPKGLLYGWILRHRDILSKALVDGGAEDILDVLWPAMMEIFEVDEVGDNIELAFTRKFIIDHDMMWELGTAWDRAKKNNNRVT